MGNISDDLANLAPAYYRPIEARLQESGDLQLGVTLHGADLGFIRQGEQLVAVDAVTVADLGLDASATMRDVLLAFYAHSIGAFQTLTKLGLYPEG